MTHPIRQLRAERGLSQETLSRRSGVARETISRIESGKATKVRRSTLVALAHALDVREGDLS
jgi:transcriptional regulator with XRE-family HTH domain